MDEIQRLSDQILFNNLIYYFKSKSTLKYFIDLKGPLILYNNIKNCYISLKKAEKN